MKQKTITWIKKTVSQKEALFEKIISSGMRIEGVKLILDDIFNDERVEFSWILTLIYSMSFAKKSLGSKFHKSMAILEKDGRHGKGFLGDRERRPGSERKHWQFRRPS